MYAIASPFSDLHVPLDSNSFVNSANMLFEAKKRSDKYNLILQNPFYFLKNRKNAITYAKDEITFAHSKYCQFTMI